MNRLYAIAGIKLILNNKQLEGGRERDYYLDFIHSTETLWSPSNRAGP